MPRQLKRLAHFVYKCKYHTNFANYVHERPFILVIPREKGLQMVVPLLEATHVKIENFFLGPGSREGKGTL